MSVKCKSEKCLYFQGSPLFLVNFPPLSSHWTTLASYLAYALHLHLEVSVIANVTDLPISSFHLTPHCSCIPKMDKLSMFCVCVCVCSFCLK